MSDAATRWRRVSALLDTALELPAAERTPWLAALDATDPGLRAEVEALLAACEAAGGFLEAPAGAYAAALIAGEGGLDTGPVPGARIGPFRVVREIGHGGMGAVYLAERDDTHFQQRVALKLVRGGGGSAALLRRFLDERQILAALEHPGIARLVDGGLTAAHEPWFAMEYVDGEPIDRHCASRGLGVEARLELVCQVCDAVEHAHRRLVVHRDLKPSNILVTDEGRVKLLDFGIAALLDPERAAAGQTLAGFRALTPEYASPEQLRGEPASTACDVYALGLLLYLLLTGRHPFATLHETPAGRLRLLDGAVPAAPSAAAGTGSPAGRAPGRRLRGDLDAIVLKALRPEPGARYASAGALADELRRHRAGLPVRARADVRGYALRSFARRHRWSVGAGAALLCALVGFSAVTAVQASRIRAQSARIALERDHARQVSDFLQQLLASADPYAEGGAAPTVRDVLDRGAARADADLAAQPALRAEMLYVMGEAYFGLGELERATQVLERSIALRRAGGPPGPDLATSLNYLAQVRLNAGEAAVAESLYREALGLRRRLLPPGDPSIIRTLSGLGSSLQRQGRHAEAERVLHEAIALERMLQPPNPLGMAQLLRNLAHSLRDRRDYAAAEPLYREALAIHRARFGDDHPETANSRVNHAHILHRMGRTHEAEPVYRAGLETKRRLLGPDNYDVLGDQVSFAALLLTLDRADEAEALLVDALERRLARYGPGHGLVVETAARLAELRASRGAPHR